MLTLQYSNIDTDLIIQARHLKTIARTGLGKHLFEALRSDRNGNPDPTFFMNRSEYNGAPILVASGPNFGCAPIAAVSIRVLTSRADAVRVESMPAGRSSITAYEQ